MAKLEIKAGTTSKLLKVFIQDSSVTTGAGLAGLVFNTASLTAYYIREGDASATAISLVTATLGTFTSSGFIVVDGTNMPGLYEIGIPNAAIAAGAKSVVVYLKGATNMAQTLLEIELTAVDNQDSVRYGMTALPNAAAAASGGLPTIGATIPNATAGAAGGIQIAGSNAATTYATLTVTGAFSINGTSNVSQTGDSFARIGATGSGLTSLAPSALLTTAMTESYAALHAAPTLTQAIFEIRSILAENSVSSTTVTTKKIDGSTTAETFTLDSATTPTSITRAS